ncbi:MAG: dependent epimerase/dehydratase family, partial [Naasia sp.]|nr:dependent epimerase/dehydratase family [Naasia sp.]
MSPPDVSGAVVVTGAAGGIGGAVVEQLRSQGVRVIGWDRQASDAGYVDQVVDMLDP